MWYAVKELNVELELKTWPLAQVLPTCTTRGLFSWVHNLLTQSGSYGFGVTSCCVADGHPSLTQETELAVPPTGCRKCYGRLNVDIHIRPVGG